MSTPSPALLSTIVARAAEQLASNPQAAEKEAKEALKHGPADPRALLILASARRRQGDLAGARAILEPLARKHPRAAHTQYELGVTLIGLGEGEDGAAALRLELTLRRDLPEAWRALGDLLFKQGAIESADQAYREHARACVRDPRLRPAGEALFNNDLSRAEQMLRAHLASQNQPEDLNAMQMLADVYARQERFADAEVLLAHCLARQPKADDVRFGLANALFHQQKGSQALAHLEDLLAENNQDAAYRNLMAACLGLVGEHAREIEFYENLLRDFPKQPRIWLNYARIYINTPQRHPN